MVMSKKRKRENVYSNPVVSPVYTENVEQFKLLYYNHRERETET